LKHFVPEPEFAWLGVENCARYAAATDGSRHALTAKAPRFLAAINTMPQFGQWVGRAVDTAGSASRQILTLMVLGIKSVLLRSLDKCSEHDAVAGSSRHRVTFFSLNSQEALR
jgi:hypothetical protein